MEKGEKGERGKGGKGGKREIWEKLVGKRYVVKTLLWELTGKIAL